MVVALSYTRARKASVRITGVFKCHGESGWNNSIKECEKDNRLTKNSVALGQGEFV